MKRTSRSMLSLWFLFAAATLMFNLAMLSTSTHAADARPNVILVIGDDISVDDWGCYGHPTLKTPAVDRMAAQGRRFTRAMLTASSCSPSRCSTVTGRYPHNTGAPELHTPLPANQTTFPMLLKEAGYYTAQAGKWHMGEAPCVAGAFDCRIGGGPSGAENWVKVLAERPKDKPFFCWFASFDAHRGWDRKMPFEHFNPDDVVVPPYFVDTPETRKDLADYYDEIRRLDWYIGKVREELQRQGVADNTLILIIGDNGRPFPRCKTRVYDSGMQTGLVAWWGKGIKAPGEVSDGLVSTIDIAATILDVAGVEIPASVQGVSFAPMFDDPKAKTRTYTFSEHNWHDFAAFERQVRTERFLYVRNLMPEKPNSGPADSINSPTHKALQQARDAGTLTDIQRDIFLQPRPAEELFDTIADPMQLTNLADDPKHAGTLAELRAVLDRWMDETRDAKPEKLTPDTFSIETGRSLGIGTPRGEMPGASRGASETTSPGPR